MGCSDSKATPTMGKPEEKHEKKCPDEAKPDQAEDIPDYKPASKPEPIIEEKVAWKTEDEAVTAIMNKLHIRKQYAEKIVKTIDVNEDGTLNEDSCNKLWTSLCEARDELKPKFDEADPKNEDGKICINKACDILGPSFPKLDEDAMKKILKKFDDGDNKVHYGELIIFYIFVKRARELLHPIFLEADTNKTGTVTLTEASKKLAEKFSNMDEYSLKRLLYINGDKDGVITYEEFICTFAMLQMAKKFVLQEFQKLDKNDDGKVPNDAIIKMICEQTLLNESEIKSLLPENDDGMCTEAEFAEMWSKVLV